MDGPNDAWKRAPYDPAEIIDEIIERAKEKRRQERPLYTQLGIPDYLVGYLEESDKLLLQLLYEAAPKGSRFRDARDRVREQRKKRRRKK